jgi:cbb3-type cytochrome c oxidase subunit III
LTAALEVAHNRCVAKREMSAATLEGILVLLVVLVVAGAVAIGVFVGRQTDSSHSTAASSGTAGTAQPVDPTVAAGAHTFNAFACAQCHGLNGRGGVSPAVPALTDAAKTLSVAQMRTIINKGLGESSDPKKPFIPVWGPLMSAHQVNDLVAYIRAGLPNVPDATPVPVPQGQGQAVAGAALYVRYGCINCHGPNALGGVPNPAAPDKTIPPLSGADFRDEFNTDAKIIAFINSGSVLGGPALVAMPHWGGIISDANLKALAAYIKTLK